MKFQELRPQFHAYFLKDDPLAEAMIQEGYNVKKFSSEYELFETIKESAPHFVGGALASHSFIENIQSLSDEIKIVRSLKDADDRALEFLVHQELNDESPTVQPTQYLPPKLEGDETFFEVTRFYNQKPAQTEDWPALLVQEISKAIGQKPVLYLKYLPSQQVLVSKRAAGLEEENLRGVGVPLNFIDAVTLEKTLREDPASLDIVQEMLKSVFGFREYTVLPLATKNDPIGILILFKKMRQRKTVELVQHLIQVAQDKIYQEELEASLRRATNIDLATGLLTLEVFGQKVTDEIARARRIKKPLALMLFEVDHMKVYKDAHGTKMAQVLMKSLGAMLKKSFRCHDILAHVDFGKIGVLCPHSQFRGLAQKVEKIREMIQSTPFPFSQQQPQGRITVSVGMSCFPLVCYSGTQLWKTAEESLQVVRQGGRNRVCISEAPRGFKPEFGADDRT